MAVYKPITPFQLVEYLNTKIIGQDEAKRSAAFFVYMHIKRFENRLKGIDSPKLNLLLKGPTGSGKTLILSTICEHLGLPFEVVDITTFSETGYSGNDLEKFFNERSGLIKIPWPKYFQDMRKGKTSERGKVSLDESEGLSPEERIKERINWIYQANGLDLKKEVYGPIYIPVIAKLNTTDLILFGTSLSMVPKTKRLDAIKHFFSRDEVSYAIDPVTDLIDKAGMIGKMFNYTFDHNKREKDLAREINGLSHERFIKLEKECGNWKGAVSSVSLLMTKLNRWLRRTSPSAASLTIEDVCAQLDALIGGKKEEVVTQKKTGETKTFFEELGIIFFDEIDKLAAETGKSMVSRDGVQRTLLKFVEGGMINNVSTHDIGFVAAGSFSSGLDIMPELMGRFGIRTTLKKLTRDDLYHIAKLPGSIYYNTFVDKNMLPFDDIEIDEGILSHIVDIADAQNQKEYLGARVIGNTFINILNSILIRECLLEIKSARLSYKDKKCFKLDLALNDGTKQEHLIQYGF